MCRSRAAEKGRKSAQAEGTAEAGGLAGCEGAGCGNPKYWWWHWGSYAYVIREEGGVGADAGLSSAGGGGVEAEGAGDCARGRQEEKVRVSAGPKK